MYDALKGEFQELAKTQGRLYLTPQIRRVVDEIVHGAKELEASWFGLGRVEASHDTAGAEVRVSVDEVIVPKQTVTEASVHAMAHNLYAGLTAEEASRLVYWGHSHGRGGTFLSATDVSTIGKILKPKLTARAGKVLATTVHNVDGDVHAAIHVWTGDGVVYMPTLFTVTCEDEEAAVAEATEGLRSLRRAPKLYDAPSYKAKAPNPDPRRPWWRWR